MRILNALSRRTTIVAVISLYAIACLIYMQKSIHGNTVTTKLLLPQLRSHFESTSLASTVSSRIARNFIQSSAGSAFNMMGFSNISIMKRQYYPRGDIEVLKLPWNKRCLDSANASWSMIVCVKSNAVNTARRDLIRKTWGSKGYSFDVRLEVIFVIGIDEKANDQDINQEISQNGDLLQINQTENYKNVGYKVLAGMQWVKQNCPKDWIYASADDDMIPKLQAVFNEVKGEMDKKLTYVPIICHFILRGNSPSRDTKTKNYVSEEYYSKDTYPTFCSGGFYSMSVTVSNALLEISRFHKYFYNDDVWFTALLRLSAVDAGLIPCQNITDQHCALSKLKGGSVDHADGNDAYLKRKLYNMYS